MTPLRLTFALLTTEHVLEDLGFKLRFVAADLDKFEGHAELCDDEFLASHSGKFVQSLIKRRLFRSSWFILGYPSRLALLLDDSRRDATLLSLRQQWETYEEMKILQSKFWIAKSSRSPFLTPNVRQLVEPLRSDGWKVTEPVLEKIRLREGGFKQSRVV